MKLPARLVDAEALKSYRLHEDLLLVRRAGEHVILSIQQTELDYDDDWYNEEGDEGSGWLGALAPLRAELLAGDLRLFPLLWLIQVQNDWIDDDELEPPPGLGPLSPALAMLADFLCVDGNLLEAASGSPPAQEPSEPSASEVERFLRGLSENEKVGLLARLYRGHDPHLSLELHRRVHAAIATAPVPEASPRTAGELRAAARRMAAERQRLAEEKAAAEQRRREREPSRIRAGNGALDRSRRAGRPDWSFRRLRPASRPTARAPCRQAHVHQPTRRRRTAGALRRLRAEAGLPNISGDRNRCAGMPRRFPYANGRHRWRPFVISSHRVEGISVLGRPGSDLLFQAFRLSTIGAGEFNGRVRDGIGF